MRILLHCHGGTIIGAGHVVRALALAEEAARSGHHVVLAGDLSGPLVDGLVGSAPVEVRRTRRGDLEGLLSVAAEVEPDVVHLDSYDDVPTAWPGAPLLSNVEDGAFGRRPAGLGIDPNLGAETTPRPEPRPPVLLRGVRYAPLRSLVTSRRGEWKLRPEARRVLVVMGGSDATGTTPRVLAALAGTGLPLEVTVVVRSDLADAVRAVDPGRATVRVVDPVADLPALAVRQDLVVSAAGTSVWELCCLGVPMALVPVVENQRPGFARVVDAGAALPLDELASPGVDVAAPGADVEAAGGQVDAAGGQVDAAAADATAVVTRLRSALEDQGARAALSRSAAGLVDGLGAWRVVRAWEQLAPTRAAGPAAGAAGPTAGAAGAAPQSGARADAATSSAVPAAPRLEVRRATMDDAGELLRWRNDPATRSGSRSSNEVGLDEHLGWLESSLRRSDRMLLVATDGTWAVGTVRWDRVEPSAWEVSVTVAPERRGKGLARPLLLAGEQALTARVPGLTALVAVVHQGNEASRRLFERAGYLLDRPADTRGFLTYRKPL